MSGPTRRYPIGAEVARSGRESGVGFRVWAPTHPQVTAVIESPAHREVILRREPAGYHSGFAPGLTAGARYRFRTGKDAPLLADPASRFQPAGPFGPSEVIDAEGFPWSDASWRGIPPHRHVLYELHIGTFTPEGTWAAAATQLPFLAEVGITTLELMPIAEFAGDHNWGYDGVNLYAPAHAYGTPDDMRRFVDRAHAVGLAVILDVVYNHLGPMGSPLVAWCPHYQAATPTDWGDGVNFDGEGAAGVREYIVENAGYWIDELHLDGLRIDAIQAILDTSPVHILSLIIDRARAAGGARTLFIVGENEPQRVDLFDHGLDALWNDDFHHTARVAATGVIDGYLHDYAGSPQELISALDRGFLYQGQLYPWQHKLRGTPTRGLARHRFVHFLENHDQVANLAFGERLSTLSDPATLRALTALLLLGPELPMLFQGQETGARQPWLFFADHCDDLQLAVREGRAAFVAQAARLASPEAQAALPDPCTAATFRACRLDPADRRLDAPIVALHRDLLRVRREDPAFTDVASDAFAGAVLAEHAFVLRWFSGPPSGHRLLLLNLGPTLERAIVPEPLVAPPPGLGWHTRWSSEDPRYGGHGTPPVFTRERMHLPARAAVLLAPDPAADLRRMPPAGAAP